MQNGFVVPDWRRAAEHWSSTLEVGPFFALQHIEFEWCEYRGQAVDIDMSVAIAYVGDHQIELAQQHNDAPSIYRDFLAGNAPGLQHVGALVENIEGCIEERGWRDLVVQQGRTRAGARFAYIDTVMHNGTMLELIQVDDAALRAFDYMRDQARDWDGNNPIRA